MKETRCYVPLIFSRFRLELKLIKREKVRSWAATTVCAVALACGSGYAQSGPSAASGSAASDGASKTSKTPSKTSSKTPARGAKKPSTSHSATHASASAAASHSKTSSGSAARKSKSTRASLRKGSKKKTARGQQKIDSERAQAIQQALIREHYLGGEAAGTWNQASEDAMRRYQADHGWQSKTVPDARALISLGLGPSHDHLLNPESAMTTGPSEPRAATVRPVSHSAPPGVLVNTSPAPLAGSGQSITSDPAATHPQ